MVLLILSCCAQETSQFLHDYVAFTLQQHLVQSLALHDAQQMSLGTGDLL